MTQRKSKLTIAIDNLESVWIEASRWPDYRLPEGENTTGCICWTGALIGNSISAYDVLYAANILEHLKYTERILEEVYPLLKSNARVIVALPNIANWRFRIRLLAGKFDYEDYGVMDKTHTHFYTAKTAHELLTVLSYHVDELRITGSSLQNLRNRIARRLHLSLPRPMLASLLAYELIFIARKP